MECICGMQGVACGMSMYALLQNYWQNTVSGCGSLFACEKGVCVGGGGEGLLALNYSLAKTLYVHSRASRPVDSDTLLSDCS